MRSSLFFTDAYRGGEAAIKDYLNSLEDVLSASTSQSPRAAGDAIQSVIAGHFPSIAGDALCVKYSAQFARRSMADLAFEDGDGCYYVVDVKTHRAGTQFNMPNLTSVERLARFYEDDKNYFVILLVAYRVDGLRIVAERVSFVPIEFLDWGCLTIGALGWGQIQIANANNVSVKPANSRRQWMLELCDALFAFYPREIEKIDKRIECFRRVKQSWDNRPD